jgi:integrase
VDLDNRHVHVLQAQVDDELDDTKSEDSERVIKIDQGTARVLRAWRKQQLKERLKWAGAWQDSGRVFTREDGTPLRPEWISEHFAVLVRRAGLPPIRLHDLRHGSASMQLAAGTPLKVVSESMGHSTSAFTADVYVTVVEELSEAAAVAIEAFVPRKTRLEKAP